MPINSLKKVLFLKTQLDMSISAVIFTEENNRLKLKLAAFNSKFTEIISVCADEAQQLNVIYLDENGGNPGSTEWIGPSLNRGDPNQSRFLGKKLSKRIDYLEDQISRLTKTFVESIEDEGISPLLLDAFQKSGVYQILYHNGVIGHYTTADIFDRNNKENPPYGSMIIRFAMIGLGFATLSVAFFATIALLGLSGGWIIAATGLFASAIAYMAGLIYGIVNDMFATKANLPYFILGHQATQHSLFISNDPKVQAIGWGIMAAQPIAVIASLVFGITISVVMVSSAPVLTFILPLILVVVPLFALCANTYANHSAKNYMKNGISLKLLADVKKQELLTRLGLSADADSIDLDQIDWDSESFRALAKDIGALNDYQLDGLALTSSSKKDKANWLANSDRNLMGYAGTPLIAITSLVLMLTLTSIPVVFFSSLLSTIIPLIGAVMAIVCLGTALTYVWVNKEKQIDNRYKLFTDGSNGEKKMDELYITDEQLSGASI